MRHKLTACLLLLFLTGCRQSAPPKPVGAGIPVTSPGSAALPEANDAADAPHAPSVAESQSATLTLYRDPATGVGFRYPTGWRPSTGQVLAAPEFSGVAGPPRLTQEFLAAGTPFAPTVLRSLSFSYAVKTGSDADACAALPAKASPNAGKPAHVTYNGVPYTEVKGGDAAMCTHVEATLDTTLHGSQCFVFERDIVTSCPYVKSKTLPRPFTPQESAAIQSSLDAIMQSVTLTPQR